MFEISNEIVLLFDDKVPRDQPYYFSSMVGTQDSVYVPARASTMQTTDNIGSTSHTQSRMVNNISSQSSTIASNL
ncbi:hypothetical protein CsSME_00043092 [Camellia sinensis var. sinensis]